MRHKARLILLIWQSLWVYRGIVHAREADDRQNYLFAHDPDATNLIQEYKLDLGNIDLYLESAGQEMPEEEIHRIPSFLTSTYEFDRVVNFYSPWCGKFYFLLFTITENIYRINNIIIVIHCSTLPEGEF